MDYFEKTIIERLKAGDEEAFEYLYRQYFARLYHYACNLLNNRVGAEEAVCDVFAGIWEKRLQLSIDHSVKSYLFRSVYHHCLNQIRQLQVENKYKLYFLQYWSENPDEFSEYPFEKLLEKELELKIEEALASLPDQCREMFLLSRDEGLTHAEIALRYGVSVNTVHTQIARALKKLKEALQQYLPYLLMLLHYWKSTA